MSDQIALSRLGSRQLTFAHFIFLLVTIAAGYAFHAFVIRPSRQLELSAQAGLVELDSVLAQAETTQEKFDNLQESVAELAGRQTLLHQRIPNAPREASYLALVTETANQVGLTISDYRPGQVTSHDQYSEMELQLSAQGSFHAICRFVDGIENANRLTGIKRMTIDSRSTADEYPVSMSLVLYFGVSGPASKEKHRG